MNINLNVFMSGVTDFQLLTEVYTGEEGTPGRKTGEIKNCINFAEWETNMLGHK